MVNSNVDKALSINSFVVLEAARIPESVTVLAGKFVELAFVLALHMAAFLVAVCVGGGVQCGR